MKAQPNALTIGVIIILAIIGIAILIGLLKPYFIKYDTTLAITGGLGSGKTLTATKIARTLYNKAHWRWYIRQKFVKWWNKKVKKHNEKVTNRTLKNKKHVGKYWEEKLLEEEPLLYSNIPILLRKRFGKKIYSTKLTKEHLLLEERIHEGSITFIDELPQLVDQFNWNIEEVKTRLNEFITFYRHYIGNRFICTAQSVDDIVVQIRRKLNTYYWLFDFHKIFFIFYKVRIMQLMASDLVSNVSTTFVEDNTKWKYGCLLPKRYQSRCYKHRYDKVLKENNKPFKKLFIRKVIRFGNYVSPLDPTKIQERNETQSKPNEQK